MPPDVAPAAAPIALPAADQPPPVVEAPKSFDARWKEAEAKVGGIEDDAEPAAPANEAKKPAKAPAADPKEAKRAQLKALADEFGLSLDESGVTIAERGEFRRAKEKHEAWYKQKQAELEGKGKEFDTAHGEKLKKATAVLDAFERGDPEGFAAALGVKDFNELQQSWIKRLADPNYMELRKIQQELAERKEAETKAQQQLEEQTQQQTRAQHRANYIKTLSETCKASSDPVCQALHDDPVFLNDIFRIQGENWDEETGKTITVEQAIRKALRGTSETLVDTLQKVHGRLSKAFASVGQTAPPAAAKTNGGGKKPAPKTSVTPPTTVEGGGASKPVSEMSDKEWADYKRKRFEEAGSD